MLHRVARTSFSVKIHDPVVPLALPKSPQGLVDDNPREPRGQGCRALKSTHRAERRQVRLLQRVLGVSVVLQDRTRHAKQFRIVPAHNDFKRTRIVVHDSAHQLQIIVGAQFRRRGESR